MKLGSDSPPRSRRGFAAMDPDRRREIARKGGKSVPDEKRSFTQDRTLAAEAGRKGGRQTQSTRKADTEDGPSPLKS
jgi:general stress protein YciG